MDDHTITNFQNHKTKQPNQLHVEKQEDDDDHKDDVDALSLSDDFPLKTSSSSDKRRSSSEPSEFFEFFNDLTRGVEMSHAEDIIFRGKLVPYRNHHHHQILKSLSVDDTARKTLGDIRRSFSKSSWATSQGSMLRASSKPRWFVLMSGPVKLIQPEMDLRDIKRRRKPRSMFSNTDTISTRKSFWSFDLLRVLTCKTHATVAVTRMEE